MVAVAARTNSRGQLTSTLHYLFDDMLQKADMIWVVRYD